MSVWYSSGKIIVLLLLSAAREMTVCPIARSRWTSIVECARNRCCVSQCPRLLAPINKKLRVIKSAVKADSVSYQIDAQAMHDARNAAPSTPKEKRKEKKESKKYTVPCHAMLYSVICCSYLLVVEQSVVRPLHCLPVQMSMVFA